MPPQKRKSLEESRTTVKEKKVSGEVKGGSHLTVPEEKNIFDGMMAGFNEGMTGEDDLDSDAMEEEEEAERMSSLHKAAPGCVRTYKKPAGPEKICGIAGGKVIEAEDGPEKLFSIAGGKADFKLHQRHADTLLLKAASYNARPIHKMAVTQNFGKKVMKKPASCSGSNESRSALLCGCCL